MDSPVNVAFDALPAPLVLYDGTGRVRSVNAAARQILGVTNEQFVGSSATDAEWFVAQAVHPVTAALDSGEAQRGVLARVVRPDRTEAWIQVDALPVVEHDGSVSQVMVSFADVTRIVLEGRSARPAPDDEAVRAVTEQLAASRLEPTAILQRATNALSQIRPGIWAATMMKKDPRDVVIVVASQAEPEIGQYARDLQISGRVPLPPISTRVIEGGEAFLVPSVDYDEFVDLVKGDLADYMRVNPPPFAESLDCLGIVVVPMHARGAIVGTLGLYERCGAKVLSEQDVRWMQEVGDRVGAAVDSAQLYMDATSRLERLSALRSVGLAITGSPDLRLTLQVVLDRALVSLDVDAADILLVDEEDGMLRLAATAGFKSTSIPDYRLPVDDTLPGGVTSGRRIETITALGAFSQFRRRSLLAREGFKAYAAVPLIARNHLAGVLEVFHRSQLQPDQEWLEFLDAIGGEAAIAIETSSIFDRRKEPAAYARASSKAPAPDLTRLERTILGYLVEGYSNQQIAERVHLSQSTIKYHVGQLLEKLGASNRTELARKATTQGWL